MWVIGRRGRRHTLLMMLGENQIWNAPHRQVALFVPGFGVGAVVKPSL